MNLLLLLIWEALLPVAFAGSDCACGYRIRGTDDVYTHRIEYDFSQIDDTKDLLKSEDTNVKAFMKDFMVYDYWQRADSAEIRIDAKYDTSNVRIQDGKLWLQQQGYNEGSHISMAGIQSRRLDIQLGTFRTVFKVEGDDGGSCASFFWYKVSDYSRLSGRMLTLARMMITSWISKLSQKELHWSATQSTGPLSLRWMQPSSLFLGLFVDCHYLHSMVQMLTSIENIVSTAMPPLWSTTLTVS
jgi:hypothetical protein